jgi:hypothetical protein
MNLQRADEIAMQEKRHRTTEATSGTKRKAQFLEETEIERSHDRRTNRGQENQTSHPSDQLQGQPSHEISMPQFHALPPGGVLDQYFSPTFPSPRKT